MMRRAACLVACFLTACASTVPKTHHTPTIEAPTSRKTKLEIVKAQAANDEARGYSSRVDSKATVVLKWLREH
jgi:hypothetical protein